MSEVWSLYDLSTGVFTGAVQRGRAANLDQAFGAMAGVFNAHTQKVDLESLQVIEWQAPKPADDEFTQWDWVGGKGWVAQATKSAVARTMRARRAKLLNACDWVVTRAAETGQPIAPQWAAYRQALRDVPMQPGFPDAIEWPALPG